MEKLEFPTSIFYKSNKCGILYPCWGNQATCKYWKIKIVKTKLKFPSCKWYDNGYCTCKEAQKEAVSEN
jgi:hypothetical protein